MSGRYVIKEQIGRGGLGIVYRAYDSHLDRDVAIKRVLVESGEPLKELTDNLIREAKTLSTLKHPHIVTVHDVGRDEEGPYVVMELLEGETLDVIIKAGVLTTQEFSELVVQTLEGMIAAHSVGLLHRDLKPPNLMIVWLPSGKFQVKILDFGLAEFSRQPSTQAVDDSDSILGSIFFLAPEQIERLPLDARTDLYSLGAIFYYTLTGRYPFEGDDVDEVMDAHLSHKLTPLHKVRPDVPDSICDWVEALMAREMTDRPASALEALEAWNPKPVIDEAQLREAASNDGAVATELLAAFIDEFGGLIQQLNAELESAQGAAAEETARTIRGTASTLGYSEIISVATEIEQHARTEPGRCRTISDRFSAVLARLEKAVNRMTWAN